MLPRSLAGDQIEADRRSESIDSAELVQVCGCIADVGSGPFIVAPGAYNDATYFVDDKRSLKFDGDSIVKAMLLPLPYTAWSELDWRTAICDLSHSAEYPSY